MDVSFCAPVTCASWVAQLISHFGEITLTSPLCR
jgi:hypothetical protein